MRFVVFLFLVTFVNPCFAQVAGEEARKTFTHWSCAALLGNTFNEKINEKKKEYISAKVEKHFQSGHKAAVKMFAELTEHGDKNEDNWKTNAPSLFSDKILGPNAEFIAGRLFESTKMYVYDELWDKAHSQLKGETYDKRSSFVRFNAENRYIKSNCAVLLYND